MPHPSCVIIFLESKINFKFLWKLRSSKIARLYQRADCFLGTITEEYCGKIKTEDPKEKNWFFSEKIEASWVVGKERA